MGSNSKLTLDQLSCWQLDGWKSWLGYPAWVGLCVLSLSAPGLVYSDLGVCQTKKSAAPAKLSAPTNTTPAVKGGIRPVLNLGSQGVEVTELQAMLKLLAYYPETVNGVYDQKTAIAVAKFQKAAGLSPDGIVGNDTWNRLLPPSPVVNTPTSTAPASPAGATATSSPDPFPAPSGSKPSPASTAPAPPNRPNTANESPKDMKSAKGNTPSNAADLITLPILRVGMKGPAVSGLQERLRALGFLKGATDGIFGPETQMAVKAAQRNLKLEPDGVVGDSTWMGLLR